MKCFSIPNQTDFGAFKHLPTALLDLIHRDTKVLVQHTKDIDELEPDHLTRPSEITFHKAPMTEVTPPKLNTASKKKKNDKKHKEAIIHSLTPKRRILSHTTDS